MSRIWIRANDIDSYGNTLMGGTWVNKNDETGEITYNPIHNLLLRSESKTSGQLRAEASIFSGNVHAPDGYLYVCLHCGSRRMDRLGLGCYDDNEANSYVWDRLCIQNAVLMSEEEYAEGRRIYDATYGG